MKTDELIGMLGRSFEKEPTRGPRTTYGLGLAAATGLVAALGLAVLALGLRPDMFQGRPLVFFALKSSFAIAVGLLALWYLARAARPGGENRVHFGVAVLPFVGIMLVAVASLASTPPAHWHAAVSGHSWLECLVSIPVIAVLPFVFMMWAVRRFGAPTDLVRAGALAGLASGAVSALGYSLHCVDDTVPFVAVWYGGTIALCTLAGALLGPRLLRW